MIKLSRYVDDCGLTQFQTCYETILQEEKIHRSYRKGKTVFQHSRDMCLHLNNKSNSHTFPRSDCNKYYSFSMWWVYWKPMVKLLAHYISEWKKWGPKVELFEVHRVLWLFIEVRVPMYSFKKTKEFFKLSWKKRFLQSMQKLLHRSTQQNHFPSHVKSPLLHKPRNIFS